MRQRRWKLWGWWIMATWGHAFSVGFHTGWGWTAMRVNGFSLLLGPLAIDVQPPLPKWLQAANGETLNPTDDKR